MSNEVVRNAIDTFGLNIRSIDPATESFSSIVRVLTLSCGEKVVLKVPTSANKLIRECKALKALGNVNFVPKLLFQVQEQDGLSALIMEWLPGQPLPLEAYTRAHCEQVGEALAELHSAPYPNDNKMDVSGWWDELRAQIKTHLDYCRASGDHGDWQRIEDALANAGERFSYDLDLGFTHFDYREGNILFDGSSLSGVVDFESSRYGSVVLDFAKFASNLSGSKPSLFDSILKGYERKLLRPVGLSELLPIYILYQSLSCVAWCIKNGQNDRQFYWENREVLTRMLAVLTKVGSGSIGEVLAQNE